jgi:hypothetical protein
MAVNVYSTRFMDAANTSGNTTYTVPAGFVAVIRDANVTLVTAQAATVGARLFRVGGGIISEFLYTPTAFGATQWQGHAVFNPGEQMEMLALSGSTWYWYVCGYLLTLP